jgi:hypothetical protein
MGQFEDLLAGADVGTLDQAFLPWPCWTRPCAAGPSGTRHLTVPVRQQRAVTGKG